MTIELRPARPFNATSGIDNNGDGDTRDDRPVIDGQVVGRYAFRGTPTDDVSLFAEGRLTVRDQSLVLRVEGFNVFNHANVLGRNGSDGTGATPLATFGTASSGSRQHRTRADGAVHRQVRILTP
jgi:hypothetical protein